jgi:hypothetical protein
MEFLIELIFEFFGEAILQLAFEALAEVGIHLRHNTDGAPRERSTGKRMVGYILMGAIAGGLSLLLFSHSFAKTQTARLVVLFLVPAFSGGVMTLIGYWRMKRGQIVIGLDRFIYGYMFAFAMAVVRFLWAA